MEVVDGALLFGPSATARAAAEQVVSKNSQAVPLAKEAAAEILEHEQPQPSEVFGDARSDTHKRIRRLKQRLILSPRDAISSIEIARLQATIGQARRARGYVERALKAAPDNRFVLRSAVRYFLHIREEDKALHAVQTCDAVRSDPWVQAAEVAICDLMEKSPRWGVRQIKSLSSAKSLKIQFSELAAGLAMLESREGTRRRARKLIERSLDAPTDNSLAQAIWFQTRDNLSVFDDVEAKRLPRAYEAEVLAAIARRDDRTIVENARKWLDDEPFSTKPAMAGSFYCAVHLGDHDAAIAFADRGLYANPGDRMLLNNKLVSLASANKLSEAHQILVHLAKHAADPTFRSHYLAANGIIAFREGRTNEGRDYYLDAISICREQDDPVRAFIAYAYWLEQEIYVGIHDPEFFHKVSRQLESQAQKLPSRDREQISFTWSAMRRRLLTVLAQRAIPHIIPSEQDPQVPNLGRSPRISHSTTQPSGKEWRGWQ